ncbi:MAG: protease modulator HflK [Verrucomicrobiae bacterium]|nr:protease modulator HflK [Verrucomicrobiae bacterium]
MNICSETLSKTQRTALVFLWLAAGFGGLLSVQGFRAGSALLLAISAFVLWHAWIFLNQYLYFRLWAAEQLEKERLATAEQRAKELIAHGERPLFSTDQADEAWYSWFPVYRQRGQLALFGLALLILAAWLYSAWGARVGSLAADANLWRISGLFLAAAAVGFHFGGRLASGLKKEQDCGEWLDAACGYGRLLFYGGLLGAAWLFARPYLGARIDEPGAWLFGGMTILLAADAAVHAIAHHYRPRAERENSPPFGGGMVSGLLATENQALQNIFSRLEKAIGIKISGLWAVQFLRKTAPPLILTLLALTWLSSALNVVPFDSKGIRIFLGEYQAPTLEPGLHWTWPWPIETVEVISTEKTREIHLGFEKDLGGPILWDVKHYEGEQNMLAGNGEELLTISLSVYYRIKDAAAYWQTTLDAPQALRLLAQRLLIEVFSARDTFRIMSVERSDIRETFHRRLQQEMDRMNLGCEVTVIGLKDAHPPVEVAPAYQDVVSAEEEKEAMVDRGREYRARTIPEAHQQASRLKTAAGAEQTRRVSAAQGESRRFAELELAQREDKDLVRFRWQMEALEQSLSSPSKLVMDRNRPVPGKLYLDLRQFSTLSLTPIEP